MDLSKNKRLRHKTPFECTFRGYVSDLSRSLTPVRTVATQSLLTTRVGMNKSIYLDDSDWGAFDGKRVQ